MVSMLVEAFEATAAPARETADADFAATAPVVADARLLPALTARGYRMVAGNRFVRTLAPADPRAHPDGAPDVPGDEDGLALTIDVVVPSFTTRHEPNQPVGDLVVDAIPGLSYALARQAVEIAVSIRLREPSLATAAGLPTDFTVPVPDPLAALALKALAWASRRTERDAVDVWRLLEVASAAHLAPADWRDTAVRGDARRVLNDSFGRRNSGGTTTATSDPVCRLRVASLVQQHVGRPAR